MILHIVSSQQRYARHWLLLLAILLGMICVPALSAGEIWLPPTRWLTVEGHVFIWQIRLPRLIAVMLVGASLAVCGTVMQALFDNPLAEPGLLGVSGGAGIALVAVLLWGGSAVPLWGLGLSAIGGALFVTFILLMFSRHQISTSRLLLAGIALSMICSALMTWGVYFSSGLDLRQLMYWMMGGFSGVSWQQLWLMLALVPVMLWLCSLHQPLNSLSLGELPASQLGMPVQRWRNLLVLATGWLVGVSVALAGAISFIGLVIPHLLRLVGLHDHRVLLPASALAGAGTLVIADSIARLVLPSAELPIGVVTATIGAPVFIVLLLKNGR